jgi:rhodanese-related sulfurtransferase
MNIKTSQDLVNQAKKEITSLSAKEVKKMIEKGDITLIDIRDIRELWKEGTIKNSAHIPRGMIEFWLDPQSSYYKENKISDIKKIGLFCALGMRSALATKSLKEMGFDNVVNIEGGFDSLRNAGLEVIEKAKK